VVARVIAGETLIIPVRKGVGDLASIYSLNPVATSIWQSIAKPRSKEEIVQVLREEFDGEGEGVYRDVEDFLIEMQAAGLVSEAGVMV
jgi:hypothetical protein